MPRALLAKPPRRALFVVNVAWFFLSHRLPLAAALLDAGSEVIVVAQDTGRGREITDAGLGFVPLPIDRHGMNPTRDLRTFGFLFRLYRRLRPDLVHHVTVKPVLYGSHAARILGIPAVNAVSGLGFAFSDARAARLARPAVLALYRMALAHPRSRTIFQTEAHLRDFVRLRLIEPHRAALIPGSGVDIDRFRPHPEPPGTPVVLFAGRLLWDKGLGEFAEAARTLLREGIDARFVVAGWPEATAPTAVPEATIRAWHDEGLVEWTGYHRDMPALLSSASIVVLPTRYNEGVPKILLEAGAVARPVIATDVVGCRDAVAHERTGLLVPPGDVGALSRAIADLVGSPARRRAMGLAGRARVEREFTEAIVVQRTMEQYRSVLEGG